MKTKIGHAVVGVPYGHVPGHNYHDVRAKIYETGDGYRVDLTEMWGSAQGHDEEHGRREASGYGDTIAEACHEAREQAETSKMDMSWVVQAISMARREADRPREKTPTIIIHLEGGLIQAVSMSAGGPDLKVKVMDRDMEGMDEEEEAESNRLWELVGGDGYKEIY